MIRSQGVNYKDMHNQVQAPVDHTSKLKIDGPTDQQKTDLRKTEIKRES